MRVFMACSSFVTLAFWICLAARPLKCDPLRPAQGGQVPLSNLTGKKLIRASEEIGNFWGAGSMAKADLPAKIAALQDAGYDGLVFSFASNDKSKGYGVMTGQWWNCAVRRTYDEFLPEIKAFKSVKNWGRITDNFTRTMPAVWSDTPNIKCQDWFNDEDWDVILNNARVMVRVIQDCGFKGVILDTEQYDHHAQGPWHFPWNYRLYAESGYKLAQEARPRTFAEVSAKVKQRGKQYGEALTKQFPDLKLIVIPGMYEIAWDRSITFPDGDGTLLGCDMSLYPAFLDGLLLGLDERATLIAGTEKTYLDSQYKNMLVVRDAAKRQALMLSTVPELARERITFSVGIWTDAGYGEDRFSNTDVRVNHRDPERHKHAVHNALAASDEYAWQWGEMGDWLSPNPTPLIREYWKANVDGHKPQNLDWEPEPKWDLTDYTAYDQDMARKDAAFWAERETEGWQVAVELPLYWKFRFDTELLLRFRDYLGVTTNDTGWPLISVLKCWQSQGTKANGPAVYRIKFVAPENLDPDRQEIMLAFGGYSAGTSLGSASSWMDVTVNGVGIPMQSLVDVAKQIKPGQSNLVAVRVINRAGPAGLIGHVKLLVRDKNQ